MAVNTDNKTRRTDLSFEKRYFSDFPVNRHVLKNGLSIITQENHELPVTSMYTFYRVGSRNERPGLTGISHLFEHMMFNGSRNYPPKAFDRILESGGGSSNAYTSRDLTVYYEDFASSLLETVVELESDRMGWLDLSEESLAAERSVVGEERRLRTDNSIFGRLEEELFAASYQCHPYRWPIIGWMPDIETISLQDCKDYFETYYAPNNALIVAAGDFTTRSFLKMVERHYSKIPSRTAPSRPVTTEPRQQGEKRIRYRKQSELHNFVIGYHVPGLNDNDIYILDILQIILTDGESSLLYKKLVREAGLMLYLYSDFTWYIDPGLFQFFVQMKPGYNVQDGEQAYEEEMQRIIERGVSKKDIEKAQNILEADFVHSLQTNNGRAHRLGLTEILLGDYSNLFLPLEKYKKVTVDDVSRILSTYFVKDNKTIVWLVNDS
ncbi:M16 family metallopeptidase [candidate division KSB1 bacterium]